MADIGKQITYKFVDRKVIIRLKDRICETPEELLTSELCHEILRRFVRGLTQNASPLVVIFQKEPGVDIDQDDIHELAQAFLLLAKMPIDWAARLFEDKRRFLDHPSELYTFVEALYDYWREFERFIICDSEGDVLDKRPYRTFNATIETLTHLVRSVYRDIQENISGKHPRIYRQVRTGAEVASIALPKPIPCPSCGYEKLDGIPVIRQMLIYPPMLLNPPMNKRTGTFTKVDSNPLDLVDLDPKEWLCYPARVGKLLVLVYFHEHFFELGFSLCNLFEPADDDCLKQKADAVYLFGVPENCLDNLAGIPTVFYDDEESNIFVAAVPRGDEFGYFGYLKKMILTLHNAIMMKRGKMPYHGAMVRLRLRGDREANLLLIGDTGTGKSETLEAFRMLGAEHIRELVIVADDMGSLDLTPDGKVIGYGTEVGAFVRLDDLQPGYAFGQLDRAIIMNPSQVNARVVLPITTYENVIEGVPVDMILYANNYEEVDDDHPIIERLEDLNLALKVFRDGTAMSKGTTTSTGLVHSYFANIFGPIQYRALHDEIAKRYFSAFYEEGIFVGQLRTRLGIPGWERRGPEEAARALLSYFSSALEG